MWESVAYLFDTSHFTPRWQCGKEACCTWDLGSWSFVLGWIHILSDIATFAAYYAVPLVVAYYVMYRSEVRMPRIFWIFFGLIFFSCGTVHLVEAGIFWFPHYRFSALMKLLTALVSCTGVVVLAFLMPRVLSLKTPEELEREVKERKQAEDFLATERNLLHTLLENLPNLIFFKDKEGHFTRISKSLADRLMLADPEDAIGKTDLDYFPAEYAQRAWEDETTVLETGEALIGKEENPLWPSGEREWMLTTKIPLADSQGHILGICGICSDITRQKNTEQALRASEERFELAIQGSNDGLWDWNILTDEVYYSPRFKELLGYQDHEMENVFSSFESRLHPEDRDPTLASVDLHLNQSCPYDVEYRLLTKSGNYRWFRARGQAIWDEEGHPTRMAGSITDIHEQKAAKEALSERAHLSALTAEVGLALTLETDLQGILQACTEALVTHLKAAFARIWMLDESGQNLNLVASAGLYTNIQGEHQTITVGQYNIGRIAETREPYLTNSVVGDPRIHNQEWARREGLVAFAGYPLLLGTELKGVLAIFTRHTLSDTTLRAMKEVANALALGMQRKWTEEELQKAKEAAVAANQAKSEFLANMSHEIRTPMNAIIGLTDLVLATPLTPEQRDYLSTVEDSAESLLAIINDILDFSKIEAGKLEFELVHFRLRQTFGDAMKSLGVRAHEKALELAFQIESDIPDSLLGDPVRLRQVVVNLVGNAVKFTDKGEIVLRVDPVTETETEVTLHFSVQDTGIGISEEKLQKIFEAFEQADKSITRKFGGTGLGLTITSRLVNLMGGKIWAESELGRGSVFHFTAQFEFAPQPIPESFDCEDVDLHGIPVLIVDDNATYRQILLQLLKNWGMRGLAAADGPSALELLKSETEEGRPIELVLTDIHMPEMDGFLLTEKIRDDEALTDTPVITLTSGSRSGDVARGEKLGIRAQLMKPVKQSELLQALCHTLGRSKKPAPGGGTQTGNEIPEMAPLRVLLAEDGLANQKLAKALLEKWGHTVTIAETGKEALDYLERESFDLVLMDVQMPAMDGLEATRAYREKEKGTGQHLPIIAMTARAMKGDREECLAAGMDDYVSKPIRQKELYMALVPFFADRLGPEPFFNERHTTSIDLSKALKAVGDDEEILREVMQAFLEECPDLIAQLQKGLQEDDPPTVGRAAHTIKGSLRIFEFEEVTELAWQLEQKGRSGNLQETSEVLDQLRTRLSRIVQFFATHLKESEES